MKFMNLYKWGFQNPHLMDTADDGTQNGGGGGDDDKDKTPDPDTPVSITYAQLQTLIAQGGGNNNDQEESITDKRKREQEDKDKQDARDRANQQFALHNLKFDSFISENEKNLPEGVKTIRSDVEGMIGKGDLSKVVPLLWGTVAKEFFADDKELANLTKSDQEWIKENVLSKRYEADIDGIEAAKYIERAIETKKRKSDDRARRGGGGDGSNYENHPSLKKRLDSFFPERVVDTTSQLEG